MTGVMVAIGEGEPKPQPIPGYEEAADNRDLVKQAVQIEKPQRRPISVHVAGETLLILADDATLWILVEQEPGVFKWEAAPPLPKE